MNRLACLREVRQLCHQANFEMCVAGDLLCPQSRIPIKKPTTVFTTHEPLHSMLELQRCVHHDQHQVIEGSVWWQGGRMNRSRFSESYTRKFARQVIQVLRQKEHRQKQRPGWALAADDEVIVHAAKRMRVFREASSSSGINRRPAPTPLQRIDEPK